jgi:hypothetical protein
VERLRRAGTPAARGGGRRGYRFPARAAPLDLRAGRRAMGRARGGEGLASFAGAARDRSSTGVRPWNRRRAVGAGPLQTRLAVK